MAESVKGQLRHGEKRVDTGYWKWLDETFAELIKELGKDRTSPLWLKFVLSAYLGALSFKDTDLNCILATRRILSPEIMKNFLAQTVQSR